MEQIYGKKDDAPMIFAGFGSMEEHPRLELMGLKGKRISLGYTCIESSLGLCSRFLITGLILAVSASSVWLMATYTMSMDGR